MTALFPKYVESLTLLAGHPPRTCDYLRLAYQYAWQHSDDTKTKNGAVLVTKCGHLFYGCNHFPHSLNRACVPARLADPVIKDPLILHAEADVILNAARAGVSTLDATMVCCWAPCTACAKTIIAAGVAQLTTHKQAHAKTYDKYRQSILDAINYLDEARVSYQQHDNEHIGGCEGLMHSEYWLP